MSTSESKKIVRTQPQDRTNDFQNLDPESPILETQDSDLESDTMIFTSNQTQTLEGESVLTLMDKFLQIYNTKHNTSGSMFENMNMKDPTSTNDKLEMFYEYMQTHQELFAENPVYVDVYEQNVKIENSESYDVYALITGKDSEIKYLSLSFISLLTIGCQASDEIGPVWSIIKM